MECFGGAVTGRARSTVPRASESASALNTFQVYSWVLVTVRTSTPMARRAFALRMSRSALFAIGVMLLAIVLDVPTDAGNIQIALDRAATSDHLSLPGQLKDIVSSIPLIPRPPRRRGSARSAASCASLGERAPPSTKRSHTVRQRPRSMPGALDHGPQRLRRSQRGDARRANSNPHQLVRTRKTSE